MNSFTPQQVLKRQMVIYPIVAIVVIAGLWIYWAIAPTSTSTPTPGAVSGDGLAGVPASARLILAIVVLHLINEQYDIGVFGPMCLGAVALTAFELYLYDLWSGQVSPAYRARIKFTKRLILPMAIVSVVWVGWSMHSESERFEQERANQAQSEKDRAAAGQLQRDYNAFLQILQDATNRREAAKSAKP